MSEAEEQASQMYPESDITYGVYAVREAFVAGWQMALQSARSDALWEADCLRSMYPEIERDGWL